MSKGPHHPVAIKIQGKRVEQIHQVKMVPTLQLRTNHSRSNTNRTCRIELKCLIPLVQDQVQLLHSRTTQVPAKDSYLAATLHLNLDLLWQLVWTTTWIISVKVDSSRCMVDRLIVVLACNLRLGQTTKTTWCMTWQTSLSLATNHRMPMRCKIGVNPAWMLQLVEVPLPGQGPSGPQTPRTHQVPTTCL